MPVTRGGRGGILRRIGAQEDGAVAVIVAIMMVVVLGMAALVVDIGGAESRKGELQNAADAAALAIAQECQADPLSTAAGSCGATTRNIALSEAARYATGNVDDHVVTVSSVNTAVAGKVSVTVASTQQDFFSGIFGVRSTPVTASATASWAVKGTPLGLTFNACELPSTASNQTVLLRTDPLALAQPGCGLLTGVLNAVVPAWMTDPNCKLDVSLVPVVTGTLSAVIPSQCETVVQGLVGQRVLLPVYEHPLGNVVVGCVVGGLLGSLLLGTTQNSNCAIEKYAVVYLTGYDFQTVAANLSLTVANTANVKAGVSLGFSNMSACSDINIALATPNVLGVALNLAQPLCQGIQGQFQGYVSSADAATMQSGAVRLTS